jgi:hypothetical protein
MPADLRGKLKLYPPGTALIRLKQSGKYHDWAISIAPSDDERTIRKHVLKHAPNWEIIEIAF